MTSTGFNIGMFDERNSSRVLRPPGGGHTDIFGIHGDQDLKTPSKKNQQSSSISSCFGGPEKKTEQPKENEKNQNGNHTPSNTDENVQQNGNDVEKEKEKTTEKVDSPKNKRIPPGGYSSGGFW